MRRELGACPLACCVLALEQPPGGDTDGHRRAPESSANRSIVSSATTASCSSPSTSCTSAARLRELARLGPALAPERRARPPPPHSAPAWRAFGPRGSPRRGCRRAGRARGAAPSSRHGGTGGGSTSRAGWSAVAVNARRRSRLDEAIEQLHVARAAQRRRAGARGRPPGVPRAARTARARSGSRSPAAACRRSSITSRSRTSPSAGAEPPQLVAQGPRPFARRGAPRRCAGRCAGGACRRASGAAARPRRAACAGRSSMIRSHAARDRRAHRVGGRVARTGSRQADHVGRRRRTRRRAPARASGTCSAGCAPSLASTPRDPLERLAVDAAALDLDLAEALRHAPSLEHRDAIVDELGELRCRRGRAATSGAGACAAARPA